MFCNLWNLLLFVVKNLEKKSLNIILKFKKYLRINYIRNDKFTRKKLDLTNKTSIMNI